MKIAGSAEAEKLDMNMTPMIDVCFQLIIFFMLSLRLFTAEGDFNIKMPLAAMQEGMPDEAQIPPIKIRLRSDAKGNLTAIQMGQRNLKDFQELRAQIREIARLDRGPAGTTSSAEVEIDCDYELKFEYVISALTSITGYLADDKQTVVRMIDKVKFAPPRKPRHEADAK